ncbi:hypothetical protein [Paludifilum halophilum]|uniref:Uncharacterized protein n=1 Tax=Paludifilum halophilum TaxID=1642702 RepID=A0A235BDS5_9BACL|nr:hypothetical protein [Paludifilum halophilum]OYD09745.1 hypothetical protein CHM34_01760 [Paludifilum halophilum]
MLLKLWIWAAAAGCLGAFALTLFPESIEGRGNSVWWQVFSLEYLTSVGLLALSCLLLSRVTIRSVARGLDLPGRWRDRRRWACVCPVLFTVVCIGFFAKVLLVHTAVFTSVFILREILLWRAKHKEIFRSGLR